MGVPARVTGNPPHARAWSVVGPVRSEATGTRPAGPAGAARHAVAGPAGAGPAGLVRRGGWLAGVVAGGRGGWPACQDALVIPGDDGAAARPVEARGGPSLVIRRRNESELDECVRVLAEVHRRDGYPMRWPASPVGWLAEPALFTAWVASLDGRLVGHVGLSRAEHGDTAAALYGEDAAMVSRLFVSPAARGHGTGTALLKVAVREARQNGLRPVLDVLATSVSAVALYERLGWRLLGTADRQWGPDQVVVRCYAAPA